MEFRQKSVNIVIVGDAKEQFEKFSSEMRDEIERGITKSNAQIILGSIKRKIDLLKKDPQSGIQIKKKMIPKEYLIKYEVENLWKLNLSSGWRMIYTIKGTEISIISIVIDILDHRQYDKKFGYR